MPPIEDDDKEVCLPAAKANLLARFFALQCTDNDLHNTLCGAPYPLQQESPSFDFPPIKEKSVLRKLLRLPVHKATLKILRQTGLYGNVHHLSPVR